MMNKQITFTYNGKDYTLEFTRNAVRQMERAGFVASEIETKPMSTLPALFAGAFLQRHGRVPQATIDDIYSKMPDKQKLIEKLAEMYSDTLESLTAEPEGDAGNVDWGANW